MLVLLTDQSMQCQTNRKKKKKRQKQKNFCSDTKTQSGRKSKNSWSLNLTITRIPGVSLFTSQHNSFKNRNSSGHVPNHTSSQSPYLSPWPFQHSVSFLVFRQLTFTEWDDSTNHHRGPNGPWDSLALTLAKKGVGVRVYLSHSRFTVTWQSESEFQRDVTPSCVFRRSYTT